MRRPGADQENAAEDQLARDAEDRAAAQVEMNAVQEIGPVWVAAGGGPPAAPAVPYVRTLTHTVPHLMDLLSGRQTEWIANAGGKGYLSSS